MTPCQRQSPLLSARQKDMDLCHGNNNHSKQNQTSIDLGPPRTRTLLKINKERYVRSLAEDVECHLNANDLKSVYRTLKKLRSKSTSRVSAIRTADGCLVSDADGLSTFSSC